MREVVWVPLGRIRYREALELQRSLHSLRRRNEVPNLVLALEHEPVITLGRSADPRHILADPQALEEIGVEVVEVERGGDVTYHGPGQLVLYPILDLRDWKRSVKWYVWALEEVMLRVAGFFGVRAERFPGRPGVWVGNEKLGSIGVYVRDWVTMHGLALNVDLAPDGFSWIVPCGIHGAGVTSISSQAGRPIAVDKAADAAREAFGALFATKVTVTECEEMGRIVLELKRGRA